MRVGQEEVAMSSHLSIARTWAPWLVPIAIIVFEVIIVLVGGPAADDVGSWRWTSMRLA
jgi:hypothetical protein